MATPGKLKNVTAKAVAMMGNGVKQCDIASTFGVSEGAISNLAKKHRETINKLALDLIQSNAKLIGDNIRLTIAKANRVLQGKTCHLSDYKDLLTLADKKEARLMQMMGILPSHTQSVVINNLFQSTQITAFSPEVLADLDKLLELQAPPCAIEGSSVEDDPTIIDAEVVEGEPGPSGRGKGDPPAKQG